MRKNKPFVIILEFGIFLFVLGILMKIIIDKMVYTCQNSITDLMFLCGRFEGTMIFAKILFFAGIAFMTFAIINHKVIKFKTQREYDTADITAKDKIPCPHCYMTIKKNAIFCEFCGQKVHGSGKEIKKT
ncbi:hypothetical protein ISS09_05395 [Candidatus Woesearchaeota archaeon]|nr:hypothetical protein [Candidatus Woesearchaeota archaeon]